MNKCLDIVSDLFVGTFLVALSAELLYITYKYYVLFVR